MAYNLPPLNVLLPTDVRTLLLNAPSKQQSVPDFIFPSTVSERNRAIRQEIHNAKNLHEVYMAATILIGLQRYQTNQQLRPMKRKRLDNFCNNQSETE
jgi:hypothetical protein